MPSLTLYNFTRYFKTELIAFLKFTVVFIELLNSVICQMYEWLIYRFLRQSELVRAGPDISLFEQVAPLVREVTLIT